MVASILVSKAVQLVTVVCVGMVTADGSRTGAMEKGTIVEGAESEVWVVEFENPKAYPKVQYMRDSDCVFVNGGNNE